MRRPAMTTGWPWPSCVTRRQESRKRRLCVRRWLAQGHSRIVFRSNAKNSSEEGKEKKGKSQCRTSDGVLSPASVGTLVALIFTLVYFPWYLPVQRTIHQD